MSGVRQPGGERDLGGRGVLRTLGRVLRRTARFPSRAREFVCVACIHTVRAPVRVASATDVPSNANTTDSPFFSDIQW